MLIGLQSYLSVEMLLNLIDPIQDTFDKCVKKYSKDLQDYTIWLYSQYELAVKGIVKSDLPSAADLTAYVNWILDAPVDPLSFPGASSPLKDPGNPLGPPTTGYMWNGQYGAVDTYPKYGVYQTLPNPVAPPKNVALSYIIDWSDAPITLVRQLGGDNSDNINLLDPANRNYANEAFVNFILPWLKDRLILGRMARWKAIYLLNGYDKVWSMIQKLQYLAPLPSPSPIPATMRLDQDHTIADGKWSARELCTILDFSGDIPIATQSRYVGMAVGGKPPIYNTTITGYSVWVLVGAFDTIANGDWAGPPAVYYSNRLALQRPLSFRKRLAVAAWAK